VIMTLEEVDERINIVTGAPRDFYNLMIARINHPKHIFTLVGSASQL
jgi:hypothetical protein